MNGNIAAGAKDLGFDFPVGQIGHSVAERLATAAMFLQS